MLSLLSETDLKAVIEICALATLAINTLMTRRASTAAEHAASQMRANGGSSVKDAVDRIEAGQTTIIERLDSHDERLARIEDGGTK